MKPVWILVANATHARLLQYEPGSPMVIVESFEHALSRAKIGTLADDKMGHENTDGNFGGTSYQPRVDAKEKEHQHFAKELAKYLGQHAVLQSFRSLMVFSSSPFMGELKAELDPATLHMLAATYDSDFTSFGLSELEARILRQMRS